MLLYLIPSSFFIIHLILRFKIQSWRKDLIHTYFSVGLIILIISMIQYKTGELFVIKDFWFELVLGLTLPIVLAIVLFSSSQIARKFF